MRQAFSFFVPILAVGVVVAAPAFATDAKDANSTNATRSSAVGSSNTRVERAEAMRDRDTAFQDELRGSRRIHSDERKLYWTQEDWRRYGESLRGR